MAVCVASETGANLVGGTGPELISSRQAEGTTKRSGVVLALETKFLLFETRQEQDSVLSQSSICKLRRATRL